MAALLQFRIHSVKCVDESGGTWQEKFGNDEIYLGGHSIKQDGSTAEIAPFSVYPHFDDGDIKVFSPPRIFHAFELSGTFPKEFGVGMTLIEKDEGGMAGAVRKIAEKVEEEIKRHLDSAASARKSDLARIASANGNAAALAPLLSYAISIAAPAVIDYVKRKLMAAVSDDIFQPQHATVAIQSASHTWSGSPSSAVKRVVFRDHGAIYELSYDWNLA